MVRIIKGKSAGGKGPVRGVVGRKGPPRGTGQKAPARPSSPPSGTVTPRVKPGVKALREIRYQQKCTDFLITRSRFERLVQEVAQDVKSDVGFQPAEIAALQTAAEEYLIKLFQKGQIAAIHSKRITLQSKDIHLAENLNKV